MSVEPLDLSLRSTPTNFAGFVSPPSADELRKVFAIPGVREAFSEYPAITPLVTLFPHPDAFGGLVAYRDRRFPQGERDQKAMSALLGVRSSSAQVRASLQVSPEYPDEIEFDVLRAMEKMNVASPFDAVEFAQPVWGDHLTWPARIAALTQRMGDPPGFSKILHVGPEILDGMDGGRGPSKHLLRHNNDPRLPVHVERLLTFLEGFVDTGGITHVLWSASGERGIPAEPTPRNNTRECFLALHKRWPRLGIIYGGGLTAMNIDRQLDREDLGSLVGLVGSFRVGSGAYDPSGAFAVGDVGACMMKGVPTLEIARQRRGMATAAAAALLRGRLPFSVSSVPTSATAPGAFSVDGAILSQDF